jgi:hypothetical protein
LEIVAPDVAAIAGAKPHGRLQVHLNCKRIDITYTNAYAMVDDIKQHHRENIDARLSGILTRLISSPWPHLGLQQGGDTAYPFTPPRPHPSRLPSLDCSRRK